MPRDIRQHEDLGPQIVVVEDAGGVGAGIRRLQADVGERRLVTGPEGSDPRHPPSLGRGSSRTVGGVDAQPHRDPGRESERGGPVGASRRSRRRDRRCAPARPPASARAARRARATPPARGAARRAASPASKCTAVGAEDRGDGFAGDGCRAALEPVTPRPARRPRAVPTTRLSPATAATNRVAGEASTSRTGPDCVTRPSSTTTSRCASETASTASWVATTAVVRVAASWSCSIARMSPAVSRSRNVSGSSSSTAAGFVASARAIATRCCCPPDSCAGRRSPKPASPTRREPLVGLRIGRRASRRRAPAARTRRSRARSGAGTAAAPGRAARHPRSDGVTCVARRRRGVQHPLSQPDVAARRARPARRARRAASTCRRRSVP